MKKINIYKNGVDTGYIPENQNWWFDENHPDSYELFDLNGFYCENYFKNDHVSCYVTQKYVERVKEYYEKFNNKKLISVLEVGCGGGWFTKAFLDSGFDIIAIEGSKCGYDACIKKGIDKEKIIHHDLRKEINLNKKFDIVCCTEVAEHIETPFSGQLIKTLTMHSDLIFFSSEEKGTNQPHYHHCNEQPIKFWINLFDFYGYSYLEIPETIKTELSDRASHIFYNKEKFNI